MASKGKYIMRTVVKSYQRPLKYSETGILHNYDIFDCGHEREQEDVFSKSRMFQLVMRDPNKPKKRRCFECVKELTKGE